MSIKEQLQQAKEQLLASERPFFLFDDDPDGLCAFLLLYRMVRAGKGMPLKGVRLDQQFAARVNEYQPDLVVILDKPKVEQEFIDAINVNLIWIDHHEPQRLTKGLYINPRKESPNNNLPTSLLAYRIAEEDAWIAVVGIVADWQLPPKDIWEKALNEDYPDLLPKEILDAPTALHNSPAGRLARIFSFNLKGRVKDVLTSMKILTRIKKPQELLEKQHSQARLVMKRYEQLNEQYEEIKKEVRVDEHNPIILFTYTDERNSFTADLSNELLSTHPEKLIIIGRQSNGSYKCSLRSSELLVEQLLGKVLAKTGGTGGGHEHACGAVIPTEVFDEFVKLMREEVMKK
ncbi:DHH family phosphoesterase [Candidatus Woesearchaeota archaeon]|nr:DHH family phosphoesterase [Candidatus Woesearchaeota archaeon]